MMNMNITGLLNITTGSRGYTRCLFINVAEELTTGLPLPRAKQTLNCSGQNVNCFKRGTEVIRKSDQRISELK